MTSSGISGTPSSERSGDMDWGDLKRDRRLISELEDLRTALNQEKSATSFKGKDPADQVVLFSGPSGTGKTLAANVLASSLGADVLRIDLSSVLSKYIGETEKNLSQVFDKARTQGAILFFDEADSLFGKRSEVADSHDRHANLEVSFLLQRIETHSGLVILSTNLKDSVDAAFARRFRFMIDFS